MKTKIIILTAFLASNVLAGGDDRDRGPVESLDSMAPVADRIVPGNQDAHSMKLTDTSKKVIGTANGVTVTVKTHEACKDKLSLSVINIQRFKSALAANILYNTGPLDGLGTEFSYGRWDDYFSCVENQ